ncbi:hypothetical protein [Mucilaginibacter paludis]|uniref:Uncharacterized protein n=1 Tax=Mucilaginibacter paludis DSM 18603 TaxID=714943 RepID=H1Y3U5_9SPHI|nr:hypothetical protein [Mucilaginibacter paludis]EHQ30357.1 hypothetical protein Mucpa_6301 [Mucilaginibacter paludis DSM 18603]
MKIFNIQPIKITEYIFNEQLLAKTLTDQSYGSSFSITGKKVESLNTMIISYNINYTVGEGGNDRRVFIPSDDPTQYTIHVEFEECTELLVSYNSSCQFDFESEGFDADMISLTEFLRDYDTHTKTFLMNYGYKPVLDMEEDSRIRSPLHENALVAIENLRLNNLYEF